MHVDDLASAVTFLMDHYNEPQFINVGSGDEISILDLALLISDIVGFKGEIRHDLSKPDGTPRKLMDSSRLAKMGWKPIIPLEKGIRDLYAKLINEDWY
jgi:GDP-L-fucose synthase